MAEGSDHAVDIRDVQVLKHDRAFLVTDRWGDVPEPNAAALGLYHRDARFLSRLELTIDGRRPQLLHSSAERNYAQTVELADPVPMRTPEGRERREGLSISRHRVLGGTLVERIRLANRGRERRDLSVELRFASDFADVVEIRGWERSSRGQVQQPTVERNQVVLSYQGLDAVVRTTTIRFSPAPDALDDGSAGFDVPLEPGEAKEIGLEVIPEAGEEPPTRRPVVEARQALDREYTQWRKRCTRFRSTNPQQLRLLERAVLDLRMLTSTDERGRTTIDAGVPWSSALFGRDSLITAYEYLGVDPGLAWGVLRELADRQGTRDDPAREEGPGKILNKARVGELAGAGEIPFASDFGSVDATPLWLVLLSGAYAWTGDLEGVRELWPNVLACLSWIDRHGDLDGDGYVEYPPRSEGAPAHQGWKDSVDAIAHPDGTPAGGPIALVEVQGYVYDAKRRTAALARALKEEDLADRLDAEAGALRDRFNHDFWMEREGFFALALDGDKRPVETITSNPGHSMWSRIVEEDRADRVARRLLSTQLSSGWGVRTLGTRQAPYDPLGYHTGAVWPHDNALVAQGLKRYGLDREAGKVIDQVTAAGAHFPMGRYPELYCGYGSDEIPVPVEHPLACRPQAWAAGAPLLMLRASCGITADAPSRVLSIVRPHLPAWLPDLELVGMRVGEARVDLAFTRRDGVTAVQVVRKEGELDVLIRQ